MRWLGALVVVVTVVALGYGVDAAAGSDGEVLGPGVVRVPVRIEHSRFSFDELTVRAGTVLELEVANDDPIDHELVVGGDDVHRRHARGTERVHPPVPGEVSVGAGEVGFTYYSFDEPGTYDVVCHLPRHAEYGMVATIRVVPE
jgi:uncharacterized cupredoxin-like copper-binding protein